jgi:hypothetical protein
MKYVLTTQTYRSTGRSFTFEISFRISPNDGIICPLDSRGHTGAAFNFLHTVRAGVNTSRKGGGGGGGGGGGSGSSGTVVDETIEPLATNVSSLSTN